MCVLNQFNESQLLDIVNHELRINKKRIRAESVSKIQGNDYALMTTQNGNTLVVQPVTIFGGLTIGIRAIHQLRDKKARFTYLFNGQGGKNLNTLIFNGEEGQTYSLKNNDLVFNGEQVEGSQYSCS